MILSGNYTIKDVVSALQGRFSFIERENFVEFDYMRLRFKVYPKENKLQIFLIGNKGELLILEK